MATVSNSLVFLADPVLAHFAKKFEVNKKSRPKPDGFYSPPTSFALFASSLQLEFSLHFFLFSVGGGMFGEFEGFITIFGGSRQFFWYPCLFNDSDLCSLISFIVINETRG